MKKFHFNHRPGTELALKIKKNKLFKLSNDLIKKQIKN